MLQSISERIGPPPCHSPNLILDIQICISDPDIQHISFVEGPQSHLFKNEWRLQIEDDIKQIWDNLMPAVNRKWRYSQRIFCVVCIAFIICASCVYFLHLNQKYFHLPVVTVVMVAGIALCLCLSVSILSAYCRMFGIVKKWRNDLIEELHNYTMKDLTNKYQFKNRKKRLVLQKCNPTDDHSIMNMVDEHTEHAVIVAAKAAADRAVGIKIKNKNGSNTSGHRIAIDGFSKSLSSQSHIWDTVNSTYFRAYWSKSTKRNRKNKNKKKNKKKKKRSAGNFSSKSSKTFTITAQPNRSSMNTNTNTNTHSNSKGNVNVNVNMNVNIAFNRTVDSGGSVEQVPEELPKSDEKKQYRIMVENANDNYCTLDQNKNENENENTQSHATNQQKTSQLCASEAAAASQLTLNSTTSLRSLSEYHQNINNVKPQHQRRLHNNNNNNTLLNFMGNHTLNDEESVKDFAQTHENITFGEHYVYTLLYPLIFRLRGNKRHNRNQMIEYMYVYIRISDGPVPVDELETIYATTFDPSVRYDQSETNPMILHQLNTDIYAQHNVRISPNPNHAISNIQHHFKIAPNKGRRNVNHDDDHRRRHKSRRNRNHDHDSNGNTGRHTGVHNGSYAQNNNGKDVQQRSRPQRSSATTTTTTTKRRTQGGHIDNNGGAGTTNANMDSSDIFFAKHARHTNIDIRNAEEDAVAGNVDEPEQPLLSDMHNNDNEQQNSITASAGAPTDSADQQWDANDDHNRNQNMYPFGDVQNVSFNVPPVFHSKRRFASFSPIVTAGITPLATPNGNMLLDDDDDHDENESNSNIRDESGYYSSDIRSTGNRYTDYGGDSNTRDGDGDGDGDKDAHGRGSQEDGGGGEEEEDADIYDEEEPAVFTQMQMENEHRHIGGSGSASQMKAKRKAKNCKFVFPTLDLNLNLNANKHNNPKQSLLQTDALLNTSLQPMLKETRVRNIKNSENTQVKEDNHTIQV